MRILVLGGTGFIGSHIVDSLIDSNHQVRVLDRTVKPNNSNSSPSVEYIQGDYGDPLILSEALAGVDLVIHSVSSTIPSTSNLDPIADIQSNLINTVTLLQVMLKIGIKRILFLSSGGTVYGQPKTIPIPESHTENPICSYGIVKLAIEKYLYLYQKLYDLRPIILRVSNPYGPRQGHIGTQGVIGTFIEQITNNREITIWGDGSIVRDYIYIKDLVDACIKVVNQNISGTFNIGSSHGYSLNEITTIIEGCLQRKAIIINKNSRNFDIQEIVLDITVAKNTFGWSPKIDLNVGIEKHCEWYQSTIRKQSY